MGDSVLNRAAASTAFLAACLATGCTGNIRETTSPRTATEQLLVSTAAERAIAQWDDLEQELKGKKVASDDTRFESLDKPYAVSSLRHFLSERGVIVVPLKPEKFKDAAGKDQETPPAERVLEVRSGTLGINDKSFGIGIPALPFPVPNTTLATVTPAVYLVNRNKQEGWAKFQFWVYDPGTESYVSRTKDLWGHAYYSKWWFLFVGPFDFSNDIYPDSSIVDNVK